MEKLLEELAFSADELGGQTVNITKAYVEEILPVLATQFDVCKPFAEDPSLLTANWVIPGHPGAVKYYTEKGYNCDVVKP